MLENKKNEVSRVVIESLIYRETQMGKEGWEWGRASSRSQSWAEGRKGS